jgi:hypothetical protein
MRASRRLVPLATAAFVMQASRSPRLYGCEALPEGNDHAFEREDSTWFNITLPPSSELDFNATRSLYVHALVEPDGSDAAVKVDLDPDDDPDSWMRRASRGGELGPETKTTSQRRWLQDQKYGQKYGPMNEERTLREQRRWIDSHSHSRSQHGPRSLAESDEISQRRWAQDHSRQAHGPLDEERTLREQSHWMDSHSHSQHGPRSLDDNLLELIFDPQRSAGPGLEVSQQPPADGATTHSVFAAQSTHTLESYWKRAGVLDALRDAGIYNASSSWEQTNTNTSTGQTVYTRGSVEVSQRIPTEGVYDRKDQPTIHINLRESSQSRRGSSRSRSSSSSSAGPESQESASAGLWERAGAQDSLRSTNEFRVESPWVKVMLRDDQHEHEHEHGGAHSRAYYRKVPHRGFWESDDLALSRRQPEAGASNLEYEASAEKFEQRWETARMFDNGYYSLDSDWQEITHQGATIFRHRETFMHSMWPPQGGATPQEQYTMHCGKMNDEQFEHYLGQAKLWDLGQLNPDSQWNSYSVGERFYYVNFPKRVSRVEPAEGVRYAFSLEATFRLTELAQEMANRHGADEAVAQLLEALEQPDRDQVLAASSPLRVAYDMYRRRPKPAATLTLTLPSSNATSVAGQEGQPLKLHPRWVCGSTEFEYSGTVVHGADPTATAVGGASSSSSSRSRSSRSRSSSGSPLVITKGAVVLLQPERWERWENGKGLVSAELRRLAREGAAGCIVVEPSDGAYFGYLERVSMPVVVVDADEGERMLQQQMATAATTTAAASVHLRISPPPAESELLNAALPADSAADADAEIWEELVHLPPGGVGSNLPREHAQEGQEGQDKEERMEQLQIHSVEQDGGRY